MLVTLYNFPKRRNSTMEPNPSNSTSITLSGFEIKEGTSFLNPTLLISPNIVPGQQFSPTQWNYASIPYWMRYYFIKDWRWSQGIWEVDLTVDVLASFKGSIGDTDAYVVRSATVYDGSIIDTRYPAKTNMQLTKVPLQSSYYAVAPSGGSYVVGIINYVHTNKVGAVSYYALTSTQFGNLLRYLFQDSIYHASDIEEIGQGLFKSIFDPFQYIVSCMWFPFAPSAFGSSSSSIKVGYWDTGVNGIVVTALAESTNITCDIPDHPQIARGQYLNREPFTRLTMYLPPFGSIPIDTAFLSIGNYLNSEIVVDHITGQATIRVAISPSSTQTNKYNIMTERTGMIGVPIQISQIMPDYVSTIEEFGSLVADLAFGAGGSILGGGILSAVQAQAPKVSSSGANGSFVECILNPQLIAEHYLIADENRSEFGRPLCSIKRLSTLSGYIQCAEADHAFPCTADEKDKINTFLRNGFFYE